MSRPHAQSARTSQRAPASVLELSIHGDELEHDRIQLEQNLQQTDLSLHLSSAAPTDEESVEYPRHNSAPSPHAQFRSFDRSNFDEDGPSHMHGWSYRTVDDDDEHGVRPYGDTLSTAAHHASALTLSAGLGGGRGLRREASLSGAEYDPERPLQDMIAGIGSKFPNANAISFDPLVVDSTVELDRYLRSGRPTTPLRSPQTSSSPSTPSSGRASPHLTSRPKLSDQLQHGSFSPKRPRNALTNPGVRNGRPNTPTQLRELAHASLTPARVAPLPTIARPTSPTATVRSRSRTEDDENGLHGDAPTPRPRAKVRGHASALSQPNINLKPPTPITANSTFAKMAHGLGKEIATEKTRAALRAEREKARKEREEQERAEKERKERAREQEQAEQRRVEKERAQRIQAVTNARVPKGTSARPTERSSLKTSSKPTNRNVSFDVRVEPVGLVVPPLHASKLQLPDVTGLTSAIGTPMKGARDYRRYRENDGHREAEARLLTALNAVQSKLSEIENENSISRRRVQELELELEACKQDVARERTRVLEKEEILLQQRRKLARETQTETDERYKQVVEEKKALEALISTLRAHLTRVTAELSNQKELLEELKTLREADARAVKEKMAEVELLRKEVERLSGEVEVLREVVEEGLKERRAVREDNSRLSGIEERTEESNVRHSVDDSEFAQDTIRQPPRPTAANDSQHSMHSYRSRSPSIVDNPVHADGATVGPSRPQFVDDDELERISVELSERRSDRSVSVSQMTSPNASIVQRRAPSPGDRSPDASIDVPGSRPSSRATIAREDLGRRQASRRPTAPIPAQAQRRVRIEDESDADAAAPVTEPEAPFPAIRGVQLERLFFSAPEHNAETCNACNRRRRVGTTASAPQPTPAWLPDLKLQESTRRKGKEKEGAGKTKESDDRLPPQTVLARVLRELEDDFTHYKSIYVELAEQYAVMDAASNTAKRKVLANHLREVIDCLEQKGDQIASLYDLLTFKDKPITESGTSDRAEDDRPHPTGCFSKPILTSRQ